MMLMIMMMMIRMMTMIMSMMIMVPVMYRNLQMHARYDDFCDNQTKNTIVSYMDQHHFTLAGTLTTWRVLG